MEIARVEWLTLQLLPVSRREDLAGIPILNFHRDDAIVIGDGGKSKRQRAGAAS
jgi:hypothetical protein